MKARSCDCSRRAFLGQCGLALAAVPAAAATPPLPHEASHYEKLPDDWIRCNLCPWHCETAPGRRGRCGVRENRGGRYYSLVYGHPCSMQNDPIEKKPFFHVYPGALAYSIATVGCNIVCQFCQNHDISQATPESIPVPYRKPAEIIERATRQRRPPRVIAYTYSEPTIFFEYMRDCAKAARDAGLGNVVVSNGFIEERPLRELCKLVTAIKIDFKAFSEDFYSRVCAGQLKPVLRTLRTLKDTGIWFEMVVLTIPTLNDSADEVKRMCDWVVTNLGVDVPIHFTRFHPDYMLRNLPATPPRTLERARRIALEAGCRFAYTGNMPGDAGEHTYCPACGKTVLPRYGFYVRPKDVTAELKNGKCPHCGAAIPGVWS